MDDGLCTPQLVAYLDVTQDPPTVTGVAVSYNTQNARQHQPVSAILTQVTGFNRTEALRAVGALIWTDPRYAWVVKRYGGEDALLRLHPDNYGKDLWDYGFKPQMWRELVKGMA
jgi:hypothetical protein